MGSSEYCLVAQHLGNSSLSTKDYTASFYSIYTDSFLSFFFFCLVLNCQLASTTTLVTLKYFKTITRRPVSLITEAPFNLLDYFAALACGLQPDEMIVTTFFDLVLVMWTVFKLTYLKFVFPGRLLKTHLWTVTISTIINKSA